MVRNHDSLAATDAERTSLAPRRRGSGHLPISNLANNVTARVRALGMLPELLIEYPSNGLLASSKRVENITRARELLNAPTPQTFGRLNNGELVTEFQSGGLTELAKEVATAEIQSRSIDISQYQARLPDPRPEPEMAIAPIPCSEDLVLLARFYDVSSAYLLQSRLDAEGLPSIVADALTYQNIFGGALGGGVRVLVPESYFARAAEIKEPDRQWHLHVG
jgi:hypothetical protein